MKNKLIIFLMCIFLITACTKSEETPTQVVRIGFFPNVNHAQALIAKEQKLFEKALGSEYTVEWYSFNSGTSEIEAMFAGQLDVIYVGPGPALNGYTKSKGDLFIYAGSANGGSLLISRDDIEVNKLSDLENKRISVPSYGNTQDLLLLMYLKENQLKTTTEGGTIEIVPVKNPDLKSLYDQKAIDLSILPEPWGSELIETGLGKLILSSEQIWNKGNYATTVLCSRKDFADEHPEVMKLLLEQHIQITDALQKDNSEFIEVLNNQITQLTGKAMSEEVLVQSLKQIEFSYELDKEALQKMAIASQDFGFIESAKDCEKIVEESLLKEVLSSVKKVSE